MTTDRTHDVRAGEDAADTTVPAAFAGSNEPVQASRARTLSIGIFCLLVGGWLALFLGSGSLQRGPNPKYMGGDFVLFLSAANVVHDGGDPYNQTVLYRAERQLLRRDGAIPPAFQAYMRVGNPPLLFWALEPVTALTFESSAKVWCIAMFGLLALGFVACLRRLSWNRRWIPLTLFLALPQTIYAAYYGNLDGIVFAALACSAAAAPRKPLVAGALLSLALLKPQVALPGAMLILLFLSPQRLRTLVGLTLAVAVMLGLTLVTTGAASLEWWLEALGGYSQRLGVQPDIASLSGLYVYNVGDGVRLALEGLSLVAVIAATGLWWRRPFASQPVLGIAWLWIAWFLATPFAHFHDEVILAIPILAVLGRNGAWLGRWPATLTLYVLLVSLVLFPASRAQTDFQSLSLLVVLGCAVVQLWRVQSRGDTGRERVHAWS